MSELCAIIGGLNANGQVYIEIDESPSWSESRDFLEDSVGLVRTQTLTRVLLTQKTLAPAVISALETYPSPFLTIGGKNADGSTAADANWGRGFVLSGTDGSAFDSSPSIYQVTATYTRVIPEAFSHPPTNLTISCADGACTLSWFGEVIMRLVSGLSSCTTGLTAKRSADGVTLEWYCNDVLVKNWVTEAGDSSGMKWSVSTPGNTLSLLWDGTTVDKWVHS